ncbi:MAG: hypothetical protein ACTSQS_02125 [Promethearchaeota archaeon]
MKKKKVNPYEVILITVKLNDKRLKAILKKIDSDPQMKQLYASKWHKIVNFLYNNTGLTIAKVAKSGSFAKHTEYSDSDLDVIFCTSPDYYLSDMQEIIQDKADAIFGDVADVGIGNRAVHIDFASPECNIDVVYLSQDEFDAEFEEIRDFKIIAPLQKDSIKLTKYAFDKVGLSEIKGYQIEKACLQFNYTTLAEYTFHNVKYFTGKIRKHGLTLDDVLRKLI